MTPEIVPDVFCEKLLCSQCGKYLSVSPVKLYDGGKVKCGRCWDPTDDGKVSPWYTMLMRNSLFKCVNRFDGCRQVLKPSEVLEHEKSCNAGNHQCQECFSFDGTLYEMVRHYKKMHPSRIINENEEIQIEFVAKDLDKPIQRNYLVIKDDVVYFVLTRLSANKFDFNAILAMENSDDIYCSFELFMDNVSFILPIWQGMKCVTLENCGGNYNSIDGHFSIVKILKLLPTTVKSISENSKVDLQNTVPKIKKKTFKSQEHDEHENAYNEVAPDILSDKKKPVKLSNPFKRNFPDDTISECGTILILSTGEKINLLCLNCEEYYGINLFKCDSGEHWLCTDCNHYCTLCMVEVNSPNVVTEYFPKLLLILFPCSWPLCNKYIMGFEKIEHESNCDMAILSCPTCFVNCSLPKMKLHITTFHNAKFYDYPIQNLYPYLKNVTVEVYFVKNFHIIYTYGSINSKFCRISSNNLKNSNFHFDLFIPNYYSTCGALIKSSKSKIHFNTHNYINNLIVGYPETKVLLIYSKNLFE